MNIPKPLEQVAFLIILSMLTACSSNVSIPTQGGESISNPSASDTPKSTVTPTSLITSPTPTIEIVRSVTPSRHVSIVQIEPYGVVSLFGMDNDNTFIYAINPGSSIPLNWVSYSPFANFKVQIDSLISYDRTIWHQVGLPDDVARNEEKFAEIDGLVSPSGSKLIYSKNDGTRNQVWINYPKGSHVLDIQDIHYKYDYVWKAAWIENENKVIFSLGSDGPPNLYLANLDTYSASSIDQITSSTGLVGEQWAVSPDETQIAIIDIKGELHLVTLVDGRDSIVDTMADGIAWSPKGHILYYWQREVYSRHDEVKDANLVAFDTQTFSYRTVFSQAEIYAIEPNTSIPFSSFAVSADEHYIAFSAGWLYILDLSVH